MPDKPKKEYQLLTCRLEKKDYLALEEIAERRGLSLTGAVRVWIREAHRGMKRREVANG
jgi:predicted DNA-binding ribbon-helix-helix protein